MMLLLLIFPFLLLADDFSSEKYCFSGPREQQRVAQQLSAILVPSDTVTPEGNCLVVNMRPHRRELIQKYVLQMAPAASIDFSSAEIRREACRLKIEKIRDINQSEISGGMNSRQILLEKNQNAKKNQMTMEVQTLDQFEFTVNQDEVIGHCRYITPKRYEISLEVKKNPLPPVNTVTAPGSIVVVTHPDPPQETGKLKTTLQLNAGERIEVGSLGLDLNESKSRVELPQNGSISQEQQNGYEKVYLSLQ